MQDYSTHIDFQPVITKKENNTTKNVVLFLESIIEY